MTSEQVDAAMARLRPVDLDAEELIGYELVTEDIDPADKFSCTALLYMILDCEGRYGRRMDYKVAKSPTGMLTLWTLPPDPQTP